MKRGFYAFVDFAKWLVGFLALPAAAVVAYYSLKTIMRVLLTGGLLVAFSGVTYAQVAPTSTATPSCKQEDTWATAEQWAKMTPLERSFACTAVRRSSAVTPMLQQPVVTKARAPKVAVAGGLLVFAGIITAFAPGQTYSILDNEYCVTDYAVDYGSCTRSTTARKVGGVMIAAGLPMVFIGMQQVVVTPQISKKGAGASATIKWGGK